ncbi:unnamed protein product [Urochloa humidicola]
MDLGESCGIHLKHGIRRGPVLIAAFLSPAAEVGIAAIDRACRRARPAWLCMDPRSRHGPIAAAPGSPYPHWAPPARAGHRRKERERRAAARVGSVGALYYRVEIAPPPGGGRKEGEGQQRRCEWKARGRAA